MKFRSLFLSALCGLAVSTAFTSCSDDDEYNPYEGGSNVALPQHRGIVLNEGSYEKNNASISFFDAALDTTTTKSNDLYFIQNKKQLGDTGQDIIEEDGNIYVSMYGSGYIVKLNKAGVEQTRCSDLFISGDLPLGQPRYMVEHDGYIYVTTYGGCVVKLKASDLSLAGYVTVGHAAERIDEEDGILYVACGNAIDGTPDNRMFIIDTKNFRKEDVKSVNVMDNTQLVSATDNYVFIQGYGADWTNTPLWVYDIKSKKAEDTGVYATYVIEAGDNKALALYSMTDWSTYETTNTFFVYDASTKTRTDVTSKITAAASELASASIYCLSEGEDGSFYIGTTQYSAGNGTIYHFDANYNLKGKFTSWGQNPKKVIVM